MDKTSKLDYQGQQASTFINLIKLVMIKLTAKVNLISK